VLVIRIWSFLLIGLLFPCAVKAQTTLFQGDARAQGMAGSRIVLTGHWSALDNPAGLAGIQAICGGLYYENLFGVPELNLGAITLGIPTKSGNFGVGFTTFGYSLFRQNQASLSYGKAFWEKVRAGVGIHYLSVFQSAEYEHLFAFIPSIGLQLLPVNGLTIATQVFNPAHQSYIPGGIQDIPCCFRIGLGYYLSEEVFLCGETGKRTGEKFSFHGGTEIILQKSFIIRFGISFSYYPGYSFGAGYKNNHFHMDISFTNHPVLGYHSSVGISYTIK
jgi:hypothetical protein